MKMARWIALIALLVSATSAAAQEYFYENGLFVGLGAQASIAERNRVIHYGFPDFCGPTPFCLPTRFGFKGTDINDATVSPVATLGYKLNDDDAISFKGDYAHYSTTGNFTATQSTGFLTVAVDGENGAFIPPFLVPFDTKIHTSWDS